MEESNHFLKQHAYTWNYVFHFLPPSSLFTVAQVCSYWNALLTNDELWKTFFLRDFAALPSALLNFHGWRALFKARHAHITKFTPFYNENHIKCAGDETLQFENIATSRPAFFQTYIATNGVDLRPRFGECAWLRLLGFDADYFEATFTGGGSMGVCDESAAPIPNSHVGWHATSVGFHNDDCSIHYCVDEQSGVRSIITGTKPPEASHTMGCGMVRGKTHDDSSTIFFTLNGEFIDGVVFKNKRAIFDEDLFATAVLHSKGAVVSLNVGSQPFLFDIVGYLINRHSKFAYQSS